MAHPAWGELAAADDLVPEWLAGTMICLFGSTLTALGLVLQKLSHVQQSSAEEGAGDGSGEPPPSYFLQKWWLLGFVIFMSAQLINMVSMAMTPQVILSCLGSWTLACNTVFAHIFLGETITSAQARAVVALILSTALVLTTAPKPKPGEENQDMDIEAISHRFLRPEFDALTAVLLSCAFLAREYARRMGCSRGEAAAAAAAAAAAEVAAAVVAELPDDVSMDLGDFGVEDECDSEEEEAARKPVSWAPTAWVLVAAISAGYTALFFKSVAEVVAGASTARSPPWLHWQTWALVIVAFTNAPFELHCLNLALRVGDAVSVVPMYLSLGMVAQLTTGAVFFQEFRGFDSGLAIAEFLCSVALTLASVVAMSRARAEAEQQGESDIMVAVASMHNGEATDGGESGAPLPHSPAAASPAAVPGRPATAAQAPRVRPQLKDALLVASEELSMHSVGIAGHPKVNSWSTPRGDKDGGRFVTASCSGFGGAIECLDAYREARLRLSVPGGGRNRSAAGYPSTPLACENRRSESVPVFPNRTQSL